MNVFLTGATGYIGSVVAEKLQTAGHHVIGLARSAASSKALEARGIEPVRGDLDVTQSLVEAARAADGVIHAAFKFEGGDFVTSVAAEVSAVRALIGAMQGTNRPLVVTSGTAILGDTGERVFDEETPIITPARDVGTEDPGLKALRVRIEMEKDVLRSTGVRGIVLRPPNVYGRSDGRSVLTMLKAAGRSLGAVPYAAGTADNRWSFVHVDDLADLYVLALGKAKAGELFHAGAEAGLRTKAIAEAVSQSIGLGGKTVELTIPELGQAFGVPPLAGYWATNSQSSSEKARRVLGWKPQHVHTLEEIAQRQSDPPVTSEASA